eukprot:8614637-Alexandrium_andersonii.AAC.1
MFALGIHREGGRAESAPWLDGLTADPRGAGLRLRTLLPHGRRPYLANRERRGQTQRTPTVEPNAHFTWAGLRHAC